MVQPSCDSDGGKKCEKLRGEHYLREREIVGERINFHSKREREKKEKREKRERKGIHVGEEEGNILLFSFFPKLKFLS